MQPFRDAATAGPPPSRREARRRRFPGCQRAEKENRPRAANHSCARVDERVMLQQLCIMLLHGTTLVLKILVRGLSLAPHRSRWPKSPSRAAAAARHGECRKHSCLLSIARVTRPRGWPAARSPQRRFARAPPPPAPPARALRDSVACPKRGRPSAPFCPQLGAGLVVAHLFWLDDQRVPWHHSTQLPANPVSLTARVALDGATCLSHSLCSPQFMLCSPRDARRTSR